MRKRTLLGLVILMLPLLAGCGTTVDSAKADFCDDLGAFSESLAGLHDKLFLTVEHRECGRGEGAAEHPAAIIQ